MERSVALQRSNSVVIVQILRHAGLRVSELCARWLSDLEISERKRSLAVRSGKGGKQRTLPLNNELRKVVEAHKEVRPGVPDDHLFIGGGDCDAECFRPPSHGAGEPASSDEVWFATTWRNCRDGIDAALSGREHLRPLVPTRTT